MTGTFGPSRREAMLGAGAVLATWPLGGAQASTAPFEEAVRNVLGEAAPKTGRVKLDIPSLTENGNSVSVSVSVESPMTAADHVKTVYLFAEKNPYPDVARFHLGPRAGRAEVSTTMRLATSQRVLALAEMNDGSFWSGEQEVIVTISACLDGG